MKFFFSKIILIALFITIFTSKSIAQESDLHTADSLFANKKYTEAFKYYEKIFNGGNASVAMFLKMAFIKEGLGNYADALYYLNLYYQQTSDKSVLIKMREIADEHNLIGYEYSDFRFFINFLREYLLEIVVCLFALSLFLLAYIFSRKRKNEKPVIAMVLQAAVIILIGILINGVPFQRSAIISADNVLLMTGPSAGAEPLYFVDKGHRVDLLEQGDIWNKILWENQPVYVRSKNVKVL